MMQIAMMMEKRTNKTTVDAKNFSLVQSTMVDNTIKQTTGIIARIICLHLILDRQFFIFIYDLSSNYTFLSQIPFRYRGISCVYLMSRMQPTKIRIPMSRDMDNNRRYLLSKRGLFNSPNVEYTEMKKPKIDVTMQSHR